MIPSKTELPNQQFKYIEEAEKTAAVQKVLSQRQFGIRCLNIIYLFWCLRKLAIERLLSINLKTRQLQNQFSGVNHIQSKLHCRCFRHGWSLDAIFLRLSTTASAGQCERACNEAWIRYGFRDTWILQLPSAEERCFFGSGKLQMGVYKAGKCRCEAAGSRDKVSGGVCRVTGGKRCA